MSAEPPLPVGWRQGKALKGPERLNRCHAVAPEDLAAVGLREHEGDLQGPGQVVQQLDVRLRGMLRARHAELATTRAPPDA